jgi:hypothetical protein
MVHVFRPIDYHRNVAALASQTRSTTSRQQWDAKSSTYGNRLNYVPFAPGNNHADRNLPIIGAIGRIERFAARIETDFAAHYSQQGLL